MLFQESAKVANVFGIDKRRAFLGFALLLIFYIKYNGIDTNTQKYLNFNISLP